MARVLIVDDHPAVRLGLRTEVSQETSLIVVEAVDGENAVRLAPQLRPDAILLGLAPAQGAGLAPVKQLVAACVGAGVIGLSTSDSALWAQAVLDAGARGCVSKSSPVNTISEAVRVVLSGQIYVDPTFGLRRRGQLARRQVPPTLSAREGEVLRLCAQGLSRADIARQLGLSPRTVETFKARAMAKVSLSSRAELMRFAARSGWLDE
jgi:two-component system response regulator NreC